ncbi:Validamycin A dioxygenase [Alphaproteobacteria bacterium SO-S41]|nr:Validamycin A dioxygenase [Alphaproteobacteria bacterium SO-S41]
MSALPIIDMAPLFDDTPARADVVAAIERACRDTGFFYIRNHRIDEAVIAGLDAAARRFFALPEAEKAAIAMRHGGRAWRGSFPVGGELTSGRPDLKEGLYFGTELPPDDPRVVAGTPLHGANLFPAAIPELRSLVLAFIEQGARAADMLMGGVAESLGLEENYFRKNLTADPTLLFRIFHYPAPPADADSWGVGEHTDYGLLTLLVQDDNGGLQVKSQGGWIEAPPVPGTLVCNIGDMLDRLTGGWYRSTPHRVRNASGRSRISFPLFYDPGFDAEIAPLPDRAALSDDAATRWDRASVHAFEGTYGAYLLGKVAKVFPELTAAI